MYLPKHQYTLKSLDELDNIETLADKFGNIVNIPGKNLIVTSFGEIYDRKTVDTSKGDFSNAQQYYPIKSPEQTESSNQSGYEYKTSDTPERSSYGTIYSTKLPPSPKDREEGIMKRCFYRNISTGKIKEIEKTQAIELANNRERFEEVICVDWIIKGPLEDQRIKGYFLEGVKSKNEKTLKQLADQMPGITSLIESPAEYVENTVIVSADPIRINNPGIDIPSPGKKL